MKPFIKPRAAAAEPAPPAAASAPRISPNELTILSVAGSLTDPTERSAYLDRTCGDDIALRIRVEERLLLRTQQVPAAPATPVTAADVVSPLREHALATTDRHDAVALVPMSAMQLAASQQPPRHSPIPWMMATLLAIGVGALGVFLWFEREARELAQQQSKAAELSRAAAEKDREAAAAAILEAKTVAEKSRQEAERQKQAALATAADARTAADNNRAELEQALATAKTATDKAKAAEADVAKLRNEATSGQRITSLALAESLAQLGTLQFEARNYTEAEKSIRQSLAIRANAGADGWAILESRALLGSILLQKNQDAEALQEFLTAAAAIESLGPPGNDTDRARVTNASKRVIQFFNITGRRKEASDWRRRFDAILAVR